MQISSENLIYLIILASVIFLIAPIAIITYVMLYNNKKKRHEQETILLKTNFENELLKSQMEVQEQTMQTIAGDLHDNIGQMLSLTVVTLSTVNTEDPEKAKQKVAAASELAKRAIKELRQMSRLIYGQELIRGGLTKAINFELEHLQAAGLHQISFASNHQPGQDQNDRDIILFRIFQEVLNNVVKHAEATAIDVLIDHDEQNLSITVKDNGKGFVEEDISKEKRGLGLFSIRKRAALINGQVSINAQNGTEIKITIPNN